jgi:hypothetical protein
MLTCSSSVGTYRKPCTNGMVQGLKGLFEGIKVDKYRTITTQQTSQLSIDTDRLRISSGEEIVFRAIYG